jgi:hypothetical protein
MSANLALTTVNFKQLLPLLEQQKQLQITNQYFQTKDKAMQHMLKSFCAHNDANQHQDGGSPGSDVGPCFYWDSLPIPTVANLP